MIQLFRIAMEIRMNIYELEDIINEGESDSVEFKETTNNRSLQEAGKTLSGFLNNIGGVLLFGVSDKGKIIGQEISDKTKRDVSEKITKNFYPFFNFNINYTKVSSSKYVICISCVPKKGTIYYFSNVPYYRDGPTTRVMPPNLQEKIIGSRVSSAVWEKNIVLEASIDDLDREEIHRTVIDGIHNGRIPSSTNPNDIFNILLKFDLIKNNGITNAAIVLFAKKPEKFFHKCILRLSRFRGVNKKEFIDSDEVSGNAFEIIRTAEQFWSKHISISTYISGENIKSINNPFLPSIAMREAMINAICHKDYRVDVSAINLSIYDDRVEIESSGQLPTNIELEDLKIEHVSCPRNHIITEVFRKRGYIEKWGRGTQEIVSLCLEAKHPEPEYINKKNSFLVVMYSKNPMFTGYDFKSKLKNYNINDRELDILSILYFDNKGVSSSIIQNKLEFSVNERTIRRDLSNLRSKNLIKETGNGRAKIWHLNYEIID